MQVDFDRLVQYEAEGKLRHSVHPGGALHVWCYSQATVYNQDWDDITRICRGLVTTDDGTVVSLPFPKFFNWGQPLTPGPEITSGPFQAYDKMDGTLIVVGNLDGEAIVSTKGSFNTWHSEAARELLEGFVPYAGSTAIFELIHPDNRIVVDYGDRKELVLLGATEMSDRCDHFTPDEYANASGWHGNTAVHRAFRLQPMLESVKNLENGTNREGFVLVWPVADGPSHRVKIKFAQYMQLHYTLSRLSNVAVWESLSQGTFDALLEVVPDEMYDQVRACADELISKHHDLLVNAEAVACAAKVQFDTRAQQAEFILGQFTVVDSSLAFKALDNLPEAVSKIAWQKVKPTRDTTWTFLK